MNCAICGISGVGYWCSEEHQQKWFAEQVRLGSERKPKPPGATALWGQPNRMRQTPPAA